MKNKKTQTMELSNQKLKKEEFAKNLLELIFGKLPDYDFDELNEKLIKDNDCIVEALGCLDRTKTHNESLVKNVVKDGLSEVEVAKKFDLSPEEFFEAYNKEKKALRLPSSTTCLKKYLVK